MHVITPSSINQSLSLLGMSNAHRDTSPRLGFTPHPKLQLLLSLERVKARTANLADTCTENKSPLKIFQKREQTQVYWVPPII